MTNGTILEAVMERMKNDERISGITVNWVQIIPVGQLILANRNAALRPKSTLLQL